MATEWAGKAEAYDRSFARLCAGTVPFLLDSIVAAGARGRALDVGTGTGVVAAAMVEAGLSVVAVDPEADMVALTAARHPSLRSFVGALPALALDDDAFAVTIANFVINHVAQPRAAVRELVRVTAPGGLVQATIWPSVPVSPMNAMWNRVVEESGATPPTGQRLPASDDFERSEQGLARLLAEAGLERVETQALRWDFVVHADDLWAAVEAGIATIGATYQAQDASTRRAMRSVYDEITTGREFVLPATAVLGSGRAPTDVS